MPRMRERALSRKMDVPIAINLSIKSSFSYIAHSHLSKQLSYSSTPALFNTCVFKHHHDQDIE